MSLPPFVTQGIDLAESTIRRLQPIAPLLVRLLIGEAFLMTGMGKWEHFDRTVQFFDGLGIPAPMINAAFIATLELVGGIALMLGLGTRIFAALLSSTMVVALLTAERAGFVDALLHRGDQGLTDIAAFVYLVFLSVLVLGGPGKISLDQPLRAKLRPGREL